MARKNVIPPSAQRVCVWAVRSLSARSTAPCTSQKSVSTVDQLSRGRVEVGVAIGGRRRMPAAFGVDPETLTTRFLEGFLRRWRIYHGTVR